MPSTNIPTHIATSFEPLTHGLERLLAGQVLPTGCSASQDPTGRYIGVEKGSSSLTLPQNVAKELHHALNVHERAHLMRLLPKVLSSMFKASRQDYLSGHLDQGQFALAALQTLPCKPDKTPSHDDVAPQQEVIRTPRRLARLCGMNPDSDQVHTIRRAIMLLMQLRFTIEIDKTPITFDGLLSCPKSLVRRFKGDDIDDGEHRGGRWVVAQIHPELHKLAFKRFVQLPDEAFSLPPRDFNTYLTIKGQSACRRSANEISISESRLISDAGHEQTTTRGTARARRYLHASLKRLIQAGLVLSSAMNGFGKVLIELAPRTLLQNEPEAPNPAAPPPLDPHTLLQAISETKLFQPLKLVMDDLVRTLVKGDSTTHPLFPSVGDGLIEAPWVPG